MLYLLALSHLGIITKLVSILIDVAAALVK